MSFQSENHPLTPDGREAKTGGINSRVEVDCMQASTPVKPLSEALEEKRGRGKWSSRKAPHFSKIHIELRLSFFLTRSEQ